MARLVREAKKVVKEREATGAIFFHDMREHVSFIGGDL